MVKAIKKVRATKEGTDPRYAKSWLRDYAHSDYQGSLMERDVQNHTQNHVKHGGNEEKKDVPEGTNADFTISCLARLWQTQLYVRVGSANSLIYQ